MVNWTGTEVFGEATGGLLELLLTAARLLWDMMDHAAGQTTWATDEGSDTDLVCAGR